MPLPVKGCRQCWSMHLFSEALSFVLQQLSLCHVRLVSFADLKRTSSESDNRLSVRFVTRSTISQIKMVEFCDMVI